MGTSYNGALCYKGASLPEIPSNPSDVPETQTSASNTPRKSQLQMNYLKTWFEKFNYLYLMFDIITNVDSDNKFKIREPNSNSLAKIWVTIRIYIMALIDSPSRKDCPCRIYEQMLIKLFLLPFYPIKMHQPDCYCNWLWRMHWF